MTFWEFVLIAYIAWGITLLIALFMEQPEELTKVRRDHGVLLIFIGSMILICFWPFYRYRREH